MSALLVVALLLSQADAGTADAPKKPVVPDVLKALGTLRTSGSGHAGVTACASCHVTSSWADVRFNHERTGFALTGRHQRAPCKSCHVTDFATPLPRGCVGCHRDAHAGELGSRCEGCHETNDWRSRFDADAHRRTNFPLFGAHAALPCVECHQEARERRFARAAVPCEACHEPQARVRTASTTLDHADPANGDLLTSCARCHQPVRWSPANFFDHDACFPVTSGPHAALTCATCHVGNIRKGVGLQCETRNAVRCTECHLNGASGRVGATDALHDGVPLYAFDGAKCASCHKGAGVRR